jgi:hypothetical protein
MSNTSLVSLWLELQLAIQKGNINQKKLKIFSLDDKVL